MSKTKVDFDKIFSESIKITIPYFLGYVACEHKSSQPIDWINAIIVGTICFCACYAAGGTGSFIYNAIKNLKAKHDQKYQENQKVR